MQNSTPVRAGSNIIDQEVAVLAGLTLSSNAAALEEAERSLAELAELAVTAGAKVAGSLLQRRQAPDVAFMVGQIGRAHV